jgi:molecular chaperone HscB
VANPFETLGLEPSFALDASVLEQRQRELNRAVHPDRAGKSPGERRQALNRSMDINLAYRTLRDPASRAEALFALLGVPPTAEETLRDPQLLMEMLEQREALEDARRSKDVRRLRSMAASMAAREQRVLGALGDVFAPLLGKEPLSHDRREARLSEARRQLAELRYVRRFAEEVAAFEDEA